MWRWLLVVLLVGGCPSKDKPAPPDIRVAEKDVGHELDGVIIAASGVYIGRDRVPDVPAALDKLPNPVDVWLIADREPAWKTTLALRTIAAKRTMRLHRAVRGKEQLCSGARLHVNAIPPPEDSIAISLLITPDRYWIGLSRINELQEIPVTRGRHDYARLARMLKQHKASAFFADRTDIELGAQGGVTSDILLETLDVTCSAGFIDIALLRPDLLSAVPAL
jgi:hypothetical protein